MCLNAPIGGGCIPSYPSNAPTFLDSAIVASLASKSGYNRSFQAGPAPVTDQHRTRRPTQRRRATRTSPAP